MGNFEKFLPKANIKKEKEHPVVKHFNLKGIDITWIKEDPSHGQAWEGEKTIKIWGKKLPEVAWTLAHELAHLLEDKEKYPPVVYNKKSIVRDDKDRFVGFGMADIVDFKDVKSGKHSYYGAHYYPAMTPHEFQASRRSKNYLKLACGALGISLKTALEAEPPEDFKRWWDRGYYYQWQTQMEQKRKLTSKKDKRRASAKARYERQKPIEE